jgi:2-polyprenyl-6-methoxyphenol hydroxylase-like FAD-dependent oxidoreductase
VIEATDARAILRNDIHGREPLARWTRGRVTLLGDAAHPMTPNLGQGACQAIEDAVVLGRSLAGHDDVPRRWPPTRERRRERTARIVTQSRRIGRVAQWQHPLACRRSMPRPTSSVLGASSP